MILLAVETATETCSAALDYKGEIQQRFMHQPQQQAQQILPMIDELLNTAGVQPAQLSAIAFGCGPGSFTGVRIAAAVTQGIAVAHDLPVIPISTLAILAQTAYRLYGIDKVLTAIDARMQQIYYGAYQLDAKQLMVATATEQVITPADIVVPKTPDWATAGNGWSAYAAELKHITTALKPESHYPETWPQAYDLITLARPKWQMGLVLSAEQAQPNYLRNQVATAKILNRVS